MTFTKRFLLWFADYREAIERAQRAEDQAQRDKWERDAIQTRYDDLLQKTLDREREIADRMMRVRHGDSILLTPEQIAAKIGEARPREPMKDQTTVSEWKRRQTAMVLGKLDELAANGQ